jgi:dipeptidyl aminopeptidase/acylaminoacyl peptidase
MRVIRSVLVSLAFSSIISVTAARAQAKRPMDHDIYDSWKNIVDQRIADDGRWLSYALNPQDGDAQLYVQRLSGDTRYTVPRGRTAQFADGSWLVFLIKPELAETRKAKKEKKKPEQQPKDSLGIMDLTTGTVTKVARVKSFAVPEDRGAWVAYLLETEPTSDSAKKSETETEAEPAEQEKAEEGALEPKKGKKDGTTLVLRNLETGAERQFEKVVEYAFSQDGARLAYTVSAKDGEGDGVFVVRTADGTASAILTGMGDYKALTFDTAGTQLAFLTNRDDYAATQSEYTLYRWAARDAEAQPAARQGTAGIPDDWWVSEYGSLHFSKTGERLFFGTAPRPEPEVPDSLKPMEWEEVKLDVWNWRDPYLQPMQLVNRDRELRRSYRAVALLKNGKIVQLATKDVPDVMLVHDGDGDVALGESDIPYRQRISWDWPGYNDYYLVDVATGARHQLLEELQGSARLSPDGKYLTWWDGHETAWFAMDVKTGQRVNLTAQLPVRVDNELHDWPMIPSSYGAAGWTKGDREFLVYDRDDIWALDPTGRHAPRNVTEGVGRERNLEFRYVSLDPDEEAIDPNARMTLRVFDHTSKASGFARDRVSGTARPEILLMDDHRYGFLRKAENANVVVFSREDFTEDRDLWTSDLSFANPRKISHANPQLAEYRLGTAELTHWRSSDGRLIDGILYKPEEFDSSKKYPMMVYFYEKMSDGLHTFRTPIPGSSTINPLFYVSRGYVVFIPDIYYRVGYPGESAMDCVIPGILSILADGYVDPKRIGVQGHSWGGYQIAYMVTQTDIFAAAEAGAPVSDMVSAYGGIRWGSGMSRMFQYEKSQSRIGGTLWNAQQRYIENSPIFWADKVHTPVLMMHNDEDTAVPWYQGIEYFVALRRLHKPVWLLNYNGEPHGLRKYQNRKDFQQRLQQFFDHYLMGAPAPVWLAKGIPATMKGKTLGLELVEPKGEATVTAGERRH